MSLNEKRDYIIKVSIPFVLEHGWIDNAMAEASKSLGEDAHYWKLFFANILAAVDYFESMEDVRMLHVIEKYEKIEGIRNKIGKALFERIANISGGLLMLARLEEFYTANITSLRQNLPNALKSTWRTSDVIWAFAGDKSTDFNHYTKRMLLSKVYISVIKECIKAQKEPSQEFKTHIEQYITTSLDKVVKWGARLKKIKNITMEDIPILRMFI